MTIQYSDTTKADIIELIEVEAEEQDRTTRLGGGDIAAVMGLSPWMTPLELWEYKTHRKVKEVTPEKARIYKRGHKLEPFIREMAIEKLKDMGLAVELVDVNHRHKHPGKPYLVAEIDFELRVTGTVLIGDTEVNFIDTHINADAKSVTGFARKKWGEIGTDEVPIEYAAQFMHGLGITARPWCLVAALRSFDDVDLFWVQRDEETIAAMFDKAVLFWEEHVLKDVPPDPLNFADVKLLYPAADPLKGMVVIEDEPLAQRVHDLKRVKSAIKDLEEQAEGLQFEIVKAVGDGLGLAYGGKPLCTWNNERYSRVQQKLLKEKFPEAYAACLDQGTQRVLRLKV